MDFYKGKKVRIYAGLTHIIILNKKNAVKFLKNFHKSIDKSKKCVILKAY